MAIGHKGKIAAGYYRRDSGGVVLFDARGQRLHSSPLPVKEGAVTSVAFGPDGTVAAGFCPGTRPATAAGRSVLLDERGQRLRPAPLRVKDGSVTSVACGPDGRVAAGSTKSPAAAGWCSPSTPGAPAAAQLAAAGQGGRCHVRGLGARRHGRRRVWALGRRRRRGGASRRTGPAAAGCPRRCWSRKAPSRAVACEAGKAGSRRGTRNSPAAAGWSSSTPGASAASVPRPLSVKGGNSHERGHRAQGQDRCGIWHRQRRRGGPLRPRSRVVVPECWAEGQSQARPWLEWTRYFPEGLPTAARSDALPWPPRSPETKRQQAEACEKEHPEGSDAS